MAPNVLEDQLNSLGSLILDKPPYCSGALAVSPEDLILFYGKQKEARRLELANASRDDLQHLAETCDAATFGFQQQDVLDETYRKAGKLDRSSFAMQFDINRTGLLDALQTDLQEGQTERPIRAEMYKLNVYGQSSFFKSHVDTPRSELMFGSLVLVFPTQHTGGAIVLRQDGKEWTVESSALVRHESKPNVAYVAFYSDVEHEVLPVTTGYRVTLTYNLYFDSQPSPSSTTTNIRIVSTVESLFNTELRRLLGDPQFLPDGGVLGFGLRHAYPLLKKDYRNKDAPDPLQQVASYLKGTDAVLLDICKRLHLDASVQQLFPDTHEDVDNIMILCDKAVDMEGDTLYHQLWVELKSRHGGKLLTDYTQRYGQKTREKKDLEVHWVARAPTSGRIRSPYIAYGNEASVAHTYTELCLIVKVGAAGER